eukprot:Em0018g33a
MSAIFYHNEEQRKIAEESRDEHQKTLRDKIVTKIIPAQTFYDAEDYHQKYLLRQQDEIREALNLSDEELIVSHKAARLNGYCGGYGTLANLEKELPSFNLPPKLQDRVRRLLGRKGGFC